LLLVSVAILLSHFVLDFFSGHMHHVFGQESMEVGLGLYASMPYVAILVEAVFIFMTLWYFFRVEKQKRIQRTGKNKAAIIGVFVYGVGFMLLIATHSFRQIFNLPEFNLGINTNMPTLIFTYLAMIYCLNNFITKYRRVT